MVFGAIIWGWCWKVNVVLSLPRNSCIDGQWRGRQTFLSCSWDHIFRAILWKGRTKYRCMHTQSRVWNKCWGCETLQRSNKRWLPWQTPVPADLRWITKQSAWNMHSQDRQANRLHSRSILQESDIWEMSTLFEQMLIKLWSTAIEGQRNMHAQKWSENIIRSGRILHGTLQGQMLEQALRDRWLRWTICREQHHTRDLHPLPISWPRCLLGEGVCTIYRKPVQEGNSFLPLDWRCQAEEDSASDQEEEKGQLWCSGDTNMYHRYHMCSGPGLQTI